MNRTLGCPALGTGTVHVHYICTYAFLHLQCTCVHVHYMCPQYTSSPLSMMTVFSFSMLWAISDLNKALRILDVILENTWMYKNVHMYRKRCTCKCDSVHIHVYLYLQMCYYIHVHVHVQCICMYHTCAHWKFTHTCIHIHVHVWWMLTYTCIHVYMYVNLYLDMYRNVYIYMYMYTYRNVLQNVHDSLCTEK